MLSNLSTPIEACAQQVVAVILLVMQTLASEMRRTEPGLAPAHLRLLTVLAQRAHHLRELAEVQEVTLPTMSSSVTTLVERGWVSRIRDARDRRMVLIELTPAGWAVLEDIKGKIEAHVGEFLGPLSATDCQQVLAGLAILRAAFASNANAGKPGSGYPLGGN